MGLGSEIKFIAKGDLSKTPPGYFWCEYFEGIQYSVTFKYDKEWKQISCFEGYNQENDLIKFEYWKRSSHSKKFPKYPIS